LKIPDAQFDNKAVSTATGGIFPIVHHTPQKMRLTAKQGCTTCHILANLLLEYTRFRLFGSRVYDHARSCNID